MANMRDESLSELEREAEADRARLARTVDAIQERVSPAAIKANVRDYARQQGENMLSRVENQFRENPLQTAAIAAGMAYPVVKMVTKMPVPLLRIGAGVAFSRLQNGYSGQSMHGRRNGMMSAGMDSVNAGMDEMKDKVSSAVDGLKDTVSSTASQVSVKIDRTVGTVREAASSTANRASELLSDTYESGKNTAAMAVDQAGETYNRARNTLMDQIERHPMIAGGIAFAVGSLVASSLPVTRQENRLMGESSDAVKERARRTAAEGMDYAQAAAGDIYDSVSSEVKGGDVSPTTARRAVRSVAAKAADTLGNSMNSEAQRNSEPLGQSGRNPSNPIRETDNE